MTGEINWWRIFVLFVLPLILGTGAIMIAPRFPRKPARLAMRVVGLVLILALLAVTAEIAPYLWARHLESKWIDAKPTTKAQLEACLSLYTQRDILPAQSDWRHSYQLGTGERITQYRLLYWAPLDAVYDRNDKIVIIYTSYE